MDQELLDQIEKNAEGIKSPKGWNDERLGRLNLAASRMRKTEENPITREELLRYENALVKEDMKNASTN